MEIMVINPYRETEPHFPIIGMIPVYYSLLWQPQLYGLGYFEMQVAASPSNIDLLKVGRFLVKRTDIKKRNPSDTYPEYKNAMIIRTADLEYNADYGYILKVSGRSVKDILSQRIVWEPYNAIDTELNFIIVDLIKRNVSEPTNYSGAETRAASDALSGAQSAKNSAQLQYDDAKDSYDDAKAAYESAKSDYNAALVAYDEAVQQYGSDSPEAKAAKEAMEWNKVVMDMCEQSMEQAEPVMNEKKAILDEKVAELADAQAKYDYYVWFNTVSAKRAIPYVDSSISTLPDSPEITVQLYGNNLGDWVSTICEEYGIGWNFYLNEMELKFEFVEGENRSDSVIFSPEMDNLRNATYTMDLLIYKNAGLVTGEGEGYNQYVVDVGSIAGYPRYETYIQSGITKEKEISAANYKKQLRQKGKSEITKLSRYRRITGDIDTDGVFKIGVDYNMGDIVKVKMAQGIEGNARLIEIMNSDEADGTRIIGTFQEWEV